MAKYVDCEKAIKSDEPYLSERRQFLNDLGHELSFLNDVIKMLEDDFYGTTVLRVKKGR